MNGGIKLNMVNDLFRVRWIIVFLLMLAIGTWFSWNYCRKPIVLQKVESLPLGMAKKQVFEIIGKPNKEAKDRNEAYYYNNLFSIGYIQLSFDEKDVLIGYDYEPF